jgi:hypothetical protein
MHRTAVGPSRWPPELACLAVSVAQELPNSGFGLFCFVFGDRVLLCSPGWPGALNLPASVSLVLGLQVGTTMPSS